MCEPPKDTDYADGLKKQQMILQFDMDTWKVFILFGVSLSLDTSELIVASHSSAQSKSSISRNLSSHNDRKRQPHKKTASGMVETHTAGGVCAALASFI